MTTINLQIQETQQTQNIRKLKKAVAGQVMIKLLKPSDKTEKSQQHTEKKAYYTRSEQQKIYRWK